MPEGDTIFLTAHRLHAALAGRALVRAELRVPALATARLAGRTVAEVIPRGKHLLMRLDDGWTLHSHLRMDGRWDVRPPAEWRRGGPEWQVRALLVNDRYAAVGYRLPVLGLLRTAEEDDVVGHLGPDLLSADWGPEAAAEAVRRLAAQPPDRPLGEALLDQRVLAGIGNVYRCELCFLRGVTPWVPVGELGPPELARAVALAHRLLYANRLRHGHITTGDTRPHARNWVYGRTGLPCRRCGTPIATADRPRDAAPDEERVTFWCPHCQRGPSPTPTVHRGG